MNDPSTHPMPVSVCVSGGGVLDEHAPPRTSAIWWAALTPLQQVRVDSIS